MRRGSIASRPLLCLLREEKEWLAWTFVAAANLANLVAEVRAALGDEARKPRFIRTVHSFGYAFSDNAAMLEDLGSKNETRLGSRRLTEPTRLEDGDEIRVGSVILVFRAIVDAGDSTETDLWSD